MSLTTGRAEVRGRSRLGLGFGLGAVAAAAAFFILRGSDPDSVPVSPSDPGQIVDAERGPARRATLRDSAASDDRLAQLAHVAGMAVESRADRVGPIDRPDSFELPERKQSDADELGGANAIVLNRLSIAPGSPSIELSGLDPLGPRDLVAWRIKDGRRAIIARGSSDRGGEIHFPELVAPRNGLEIVVTAADSTPENPGASSARRSKGLLPSAPDAVVLDAYGSEYAVRIVPSEATGEIWLADAEGRVFAQYAVPNTPIASSRVLDVTLGLLADDTHVLVAHVLEDGRRSDWREIELGTPDGG